MGHLEPKISEICSYNLWPYAATSFYSHVLLISNFLTYITEKMQSFALNFGPTNSILARGIYYCQNGSFLRKSCLNMLGLFLLNHFNQEIFFVDLYLKLEFIFKNSIKKIYISYSEIQLVLLGIEIRYYVLHFTRP